MKRGPKPKEKAPNFLNNNLKILNASFRKNFSHDKSAFETYECNFRNLRDTFAKIPFLDASVEVRRWENKMIILLALRNNCSVEIVSEVVVGALLKNEELTYSFYRDHVLVSKGTHKSERVLDAINGLMGYNPLIP